MSAISLLTLAAQEELALARAPAARARIARELSRAVCQEAEGLDGPDVAALRESLHVIFAALAWSES